MENGGMTVLWISDALTAGKVSRVRLPFTRLDDIHPIADVNRVRSAYMKFSLFVMSLSDAGNKHHFLFGRRPQGRHGHEKSRFCNIVLHVVHMDIPMLRGVPYMG
ncbi:MAG: hypothetical protein NC080_11350 [Paraprevotella sp.]|nr:hypothetical protein [Paraprevotella sp.]